MQGHCTGEHTNSAAARGALRPEARRGSTKFNEREVTGKSKNALCTTTAQPRAKAAGGGRAAQAATPTKIENTLGNKRENAPEQIDALDLTDAALITSTIAARDRGACGAAAALCNRCQTATHVSKFFFQKIIRNKSHLFALVPPTKPPANWQFARP